MKKIIAFLNDCIAELKKVVWPSREEAIESTKVVFISTVLIATFFGLVDVLFVFGFDLLF